VPALFESILYQTEDRVPVLTQVGSFTVFAWCGEGGRVALSAVATPGPGEVYLSEPFVSGERSDGPPALASLDGRPYLAWKAAGSDTIYLAPIDLATPHENYPVVAGLGAREQVAVGGGPVSLLALADRLVVGHVNADGHPAFVTVIPADRCPADPLGPMEAFPAGLDSACELRRIGPAEEAAIGAGIAWDVAGICPNRESLLLVGPGWYSLYLTLKEGQPDVYSAGDSGEWEGLAGHRNLFDEVVDPPEEPSPHWHAIGISDATDLAGQADALDAIDAAGLRERYDALAETEHAGRLGDADFAAAWQALEQLRGFVRRAAEAGDWVVHRRRVPAVAGDPLPELEPVVAASPTLEEAARLAPERLGVLRKCMDSHGVEPNSSENEWPFNLLSRGTVAYGSGRLARDGDAVVHDYDPAELTRCHRVAAEVTARLARLPIRNSELAEPFEPFCLPINRDDSAADGDLDEAAIRAAFRGTLHPWATVRIEPIEGCDVRDIESEVSFYGHRRQQVRQHAQGWADLDSWLAEQPDLAGAWYVSVDGGVEGVDAVRLIVARTTAGSLAGAATTGRAYGITHAYTPERIARELVKAERESDPRWRDTSGRIVARATLSAFVPAELDAWTEATASAARALRSKERAPFWRARFRELPPLRQLPLPPAWATVQRCLGNGRFDRQHAQTTCGPFVGWSPFGDLDATGDLSYRFGPEEVAERAAWLADLDEAWLRRRYDDLRATDYADQRSESDWHQTLGVFEAVRDLYAEAAREGWSVVVAITGRSGDEPAPKPAKKPAKRKKTGGDAVTDCEADDALLAPVLEAMETYGMDAEGDDWPHNGISHRAVRYTCGQVAQPEREGAHRHDLAELERCRRLAQEAEDLLSAYAPDHDQGGPYRAFFVAANVGDPVAEAITEGFLREHVFGGTICPRNHVGIDRLAALPCDPDVLARFVPWFEGQPGLHGHAFVQIGTASDDESGVVCPLLAVAITDAGSVVGVCGYAVWA